jgi:hypothetical protein
MISHKFRAIFVHVPKTGGQSIDRVFLKLHGLTWKTRSALLLRQNPDPAKGPERLAHLKATEYVSLGYVNADVFESYFKFAFVRNPWDRLVSEYHFRRLEPEKSFRRFVDESFAELDDYSDRSRHIIPQIDFVTDERGEINVDFIGRFETLAADFATVADKLGLGSVELGHHNRSARGGMGRKLFARRSRARVSRRLKDYYDPKLRDRVGEFYAEDIARFGYEFEVPGGS